MPFRNHASGRVARTLAAVLFGAVGVLALSGGSPVHADNSIIESTPANGAELTTQPTEIVTVFENSIGGGTAVVVCDNDPVSGIGDPQVSNENRTITLAVTQPLVGECVVSFTLLNTDSVEDARVSFSFTVAEGAGTGTPGDTTAAGDTATPTDPTTDVVSESDIENASNVSSAPIWLGRVLSIVGLSVLFGSLVLIVAAWPEGPEYVLALRFLRSAWIVGLVGTFIYVAALSAAVKGDSFGSGLNPGGWFDLFDAGWAGRAAVMRVVFAVACGWVVLKPERVIDPTTNMLALGIPALAVITLGLSRTGGSLAPLGVLASIVHVLAMAVWLGGVILLARVVLAGPGEEDLVHAVRGFGRISNPAIIATVISGLVQLYRQDWGELFTSGHGRVLLLKTVAVGGMVFVGMTARQIARAKLTRASELSIKTADRMRRAFGTEAAIGLLVVALTGWMLQLDPGKEPDSGGDFAVNESMQDQNENPNLVLELGLSPGRAGINAIRVAVTRPETGLSGLVLTFYPPAESGLTPIQQPIPLTAAGVAESGDGGGIPLNFPGTWQLVVEAATPAGQITPINTRVEIRDENGDLPAVGPANLPSPPVTASTTAATAPPTSTPPETTEPE